MAPRPLALLRRQRQPLALGEIVKAELGVLETDTRAETAEKLHATLADLLDEPERTWVEQHLAPLLGLPAEEVDRSQSPAAWRRWLEALADRYPLVLVFEDLQWADDELLDFADGLVEWVAGVPLLVVCTTRPEHFERRPGWGGGKRNAVAVSLGALGDADTARIVAAALDQAVLPAETQAALLERADGNPLYAEQYARMVAEGAAPDALPENVQGIVAARLDLLAAAEKSLLQDAAVIGRVFWPRALDASEDRLHALVRKEFVRRERRSSIAGEPEYSFAHALVRDVAYAQIPRNARAERHRRAAAWIESLPADRAVDRAELLAHHYGAAIELGAAAGAETGDLHEPARRAYRDAGDRAFSLNALPAAARFYTQALDLWPADDPDCPALLLARCETLMLTGGDAIADAEAAIALLHGAGEAEAEAEMTLARACWLAGRGTEARVHADRAHGLVAGLPASPVKALVLVEQARLRMLGGERTAAIELASEGLALSEALGIEALQASALISRGTARTDGGELDDLRRGVAIAEASSSIDQLYRGLNNLGEHAFHAGDLRGMGANYDRVRGLARQYGHTTQLWWIDGQDTVLQFLLGDWDASLALADSLVAREREGHRHVLALNGYLMRATIRHARNEPGALADGEAGVESARRIGDPHAVGPAFACQSRLLALEGDRVAARALLEELIELWERKPDALYTWEPPLAWAFALVGRPSEYAKLLEREHRAGPWVAAARASCERDFLRMAEIYDELGARSDAAEARVMAAESLLERGDRAGSEAQLAQALAFYRSVGATRLIREAERLLPASA